MDREKEILALLEEIDTTFAVLNIGQDHGITPQAAKACREAWISVRKAMGRDQVFISCLDNAFRDCLCQ